MQTNFPKAVAFSTTVALLGQAVTLATNKRKHGGCYEKVAGGYRVFWLAAGTAHNFAW